VPAAERIVPLVPDNHLEACVFIGITDAPRRIKPKAQVYSRLSRTDNASQRLLLTVTAFLEFCRSKAISYLPTPGLKGISTPQLCP
jgi:hypothetical protein